MNKQGLDMRHTPDNGTHSGTGRGNTEVRKRFDLSVPQVAGSAVAAVVAAKLASSLGVYGTILGAGVISVIATCGGPVLQHLFKRTGEQMRATAPARQPKRAPETGEFGEPTTHGTRMRGWKRPALAAAAVFLLAMGGITAYELTSGQDLGGTKGSTTFGSAVRGGGTGKDEPPPRKPEGERGAGPGAPSPGRTPGGGGTGSAVPDPTGTPTPTPSASTGTAEPTTEPTTEPTEEPTTEPPTTPPASTGTPPAG
ncbi:hypothetical protein ACIRSU_30470 [Streptomyces sp. NPDC101160]|uniref:hypothetical protein n=1 Tax=Streptomyces sp. NPDC101160 TaxID=3366118 RepID=UPI0037F50436